MDPAIPIRLILAVLLGGVIGLEREIRDKPASLRTNIMICVGSTLFMSLSTQVAKLLGGDPTRIAAQIISGIGFLGAGAVLHETVRARRQVERSDRARRIREQRHAREVRSDARHLADQTVRGHDRVVLAHALLRAGGDDDPLRDIGRAA